MDAGGDTKGVTEQLDETFLRVKGEKFSGVVVELEAPDDLDCFHRVLCGLDVVFGSDGSFDDRDGVLEYPV